jgi:hypothetical protein
MFTAGAALSGHHLPGHLERCIYLTNIPASCPRAVLTDAVKVAIGQASIAAAAVALSLLPPEDTDADTIPLSKMQVTALDRVALAQPSWSRRGSTYSFDR